MKRREFLKAVGAVPVATYFAGLSTSTLPNVVAGPLTPKLLPWQERIWSLLEAGNKVMYVTSTQKNADRVFNIFERHENLFTSNMQGPTIGRRADLIIIDDFADNMDRDWYEYAVRTRLTPDGKTDWIYT